MEKFRFRKDENKVLGAGEFNVDHDTARHIIYTGLYEGDTIVALLVATDEDAHQGSIDRIGNKITRAMNSQAALVAALEDMMEWARAVSDEYIDGGDLRKDYRDSLSGARAALDLAKA